MPDPKPLILVLEDEKELAQFIADELEQADMMVQVFHRVEQVLPFLKRHHVNLMLLDVGLPDGTGFDALEGVRAADIHTPAIFLTANDTESDRVKGLTIGADDFVPKPFSFPELIARIKAVLRRTETARDYRVTNNADVAQEPFNFCGAKVIPAKMRMEMPSGELVKIGKKELGILSYLTRHPGEVVTRAALIHAVWGIHADIKSRSLDQYIVKIRDLLGTHQCQEDCFKTIHGIGYLYEPDPSGLSAATEAS